MAVYLSPSPRGRQLCRQHKRI